VKDWDRDEPDRAGLLRVQVVESGPRSRRTRQGSVFFEKTLNGLDSLVS
jgi:hypothetical protein